MARLLHRFQSRQGEQSPRPLSRSGFRNLTDQRFSANGIKQISIVGLRESSADVVTDTGVATGNGQVGTGNVTQAGSKYAVEPITVHGWGGRAIFPSSAAPSIVLTIAPRYSEHVNPWGGASVSVLLFSGTNLAPILDFVGANKWTITAMGKWGTRAMQRFSVAAGDPIAADTDLWL